MGRITIEFECVAKTMKFEDLEYQIHDEVKQKKEEICEEENASIKDFYWSQYNILDFDNHATVVLSYRPRFEFEDMSIKELEDELEELKEDLEDASEEYEDIEDLVEDEYDDYDFDSEEEYKGRCRELEVDIFVLNSDIELIEKIIKEKT